MNETVVGILGGMGPEATVELFRRIVASTPVDRDQDHLRILIDNNPRIPDRTAAILGTGPDPLVELTESAKLLDAQEPYSSSCLQHSTPLATRPLPVCVSACSRQD